jgi:hypothetical protein
MTHISQQTNIFQKDATKESWKEHVSNFAHDEGITAFRAVVVTSSTALAVGQAGIEVHPFKVGSLTQALGF